MEKVKSDNTSTDTYSQLWLLEEEALQPPQYDVVAQCHRQDTLLGERRLLLAQCAVLAVALALFTPVCAKGTTVIGGGHMDHPTDKVAQILATL